MYTGSLAGQFRIVRERGLDERKDLTGGSSTVLHVLEDESQEFVAVVETTLGIVVTVVCAHWFDEME
jgi:hypothetical protein